MSKIVIVGTRGSGKTTLMTVLAKNYQKERDGIVLIANDKDTMEFTERNWRSLSQDSEWPAQTPPGVLVRLEWSVRVNGEDSDVIHMVDFAGETFKDVFGRSNPSDPNNKAALLNDKELSPLIKRLDESDVVLVLINLRDFLNEQGKDIQFETQWALRGALDYLHIAGNLNQRNIAVVLTQIDEYENLIKGRKDWKDVIMEHLPHLQIVQKYGDVKYIGVSAVYGTSVKDLGDGHVVTCPAINFTSLYLEELMSYLFNSTKRNPPPLSYDFSAAKPEIGSGITSIIGEFIGLSITNIIAGFVGLLLVVILLLIIWAVLFGR